MIGRILLVLAATATIGGGVALAQSQSEAAALALARRQADEAMRRSGELEKESAAATDKAAKARAEASALAARIEAAEADITAAEARIRIIENQRAEQRARLAERQRPLIHLTGALQTMSRRPPALALIQRGSVSDLVHIRSLLASTLPVIRARTAGLRGEIAAGNRLRGEAEVAVAALIAGQQELKSRRMALATLESGQRQRSEELIRSALFESDRALAFTEEARDLDEQSGSRRARAQTETRLMALPGPLPRPGSRRQAQRVELPYRLPVEGRVVRGMGELSDAGVHARGVTLETRNGAEVTAPAPGRILYAAPFRGYDNVVIIDHGNGWTSTITSLGSLAVRPREQVAAGAPIGRAAAGSVSIELRHRGQPTPIAPLIGAS